LPRKVGILDRAAGRLCRAGAPALWPRSAPGLPARRHRVGFVVVVCIRLLHSIITSRYRKSRSVV
jgi:hypothetical protein